MKLLIAVLVGTLLSSGLDAKPRKANKRAQAVSGILIGGVGR